MCSATGHQVAKGAAYTPREIHYADRTQSGSDRMQFDQLKRREFVTLLGGAAAAWPLAARAQQGEQMHRVGVLIAGLTEKDSEGQLRMAAFRGGLQNLGWS